MHGAMHLVCNVIRRCIMERLPPFVGFLENINLYFLQQQIITACACNRMMNLFNVENEILHSTSNSVLFSIPIYSRKSHLYRNE